MNSDIKPVELSLIFDLFESNPGYILDFTNRTFAEFFEQEVGVDIYDDVYAQHGTSKGKRLRTFLIRGQRTAVLKALTALWEYRESKLRRLGNTDPIPNAREEMSAIIKRLGGKPLPGAKPASTIHHVDPLAIARLGREFDALHGLSPQPRGYAFEKFLKSLFDAYNLQARDAFRVRGEQIDGSFSLGDMIYLLEARWQNAPANASDLRSFQGKVGDRPDWTLGLFVSYAGFTDDGLSAFRAKRIILMDGLDIHDTLKETYSISDVIRAKIRRASETSQAFVRVRDLFS